MTATLAKLVAADPVQAALSLADVIREQAKTIASLRIDLGQLQRRYDAVSALQMANFRQMMEAEGVATSSCDGAVVLAEGFRFEPDHSPRIAELEAEVERLKHEAGARYEAREA